MAIFYNEKNEELDSLLDKAKEKDSATILIPDLQRPFVWTPNQVILLIDSLIRGWPFGTLLMWKLAKDDLQTIPHRSFWRVIDHTEESKDSTIEAKSPPADYYMVLDGQQRLQSLLLALGGDSWGFKMGDTDWALELQERRTRQGRHKHWSKASLCFDLVAFLDEYEKGKQILLSADFRKVLQWVITDPTSGQSSYKKPDTYEEVLPKAYNEKGRFIRLSRIWDQASNNPNYKEAQFKKILIDFLPEQDVPKERIDKLVLPMAELMTTIRDIRRSKVTYLEIAPYDKNYWIRDDYNDAIVNIFTRLNTAGRTLTREEITLAWLKTGWDAKGVEGKSAGECFKELDDYFSAQGFEIKIDDIVRVVSFMWAVAFRGGKLLADKDLLQGSILCKMAETLSSNWRTITDSIKEGIDVVKERNLAYGKTGEFSSLNSMAVIWAWIFVTNLWGNKRDLRNLQKDDYQKRCYEVLSDSIDRWIFCSQWANRWGSSAFQYLVTYANDLSQILTKADQENDLVAVQTIFASYLDNLIRGVVNDAVNYINTLNVTSRSRVSRYRDVLWVWHRLDADRWEKSKIQLRIKKQKSVQLDVDHSVSYALWENRIKNDVLSEEFKKRFPDSTDALDFINSLGNCTLLEKTFNISKCAFTLRYFIEQVHEIINEKVSLEAWSKALLLSSVIIDCDKATLDQIVEEIEKRDTDIRRDLELFVRGEKMRADL